jgi:glycosyltransferase involved in cell wall biosynthesis
MAKLTIALICRDEERNLPAWLAAVTPVADEIVAVDSGSSDATVALLRAAGARVEFRPWSGYTDQRNTCASLASHDWVLFLDADERPDQELRDALTRLKQDPQPSQAAFGLAFKVFFFGRFLRHGGYYPERHLRLYRRGQAVWEKREVHERLVPHGPVGRLPGHVEHHSYATVGQYLKRMDRYSAEAARQMHAAGRSAGPAQAWGHAAWAFTHRYVLRLGFLDGYPGYLAARLEALYTLTKYTRLWELGRGVEDGP